MSDLARANGTGSLALRGRSRLRLSTRPADRVSCTLSAAWQAGRIEPAEALRFE